MREPKLERDGATTYLTVIAEACKRERNLACNMALSRARALLVRETEALLERIQAVPPTDRDSGATARQAWINNGVTVVRPSDVYESEGSDCVWVLARLDLTALATAPNAPPLTARMLENHLRSIAPAQAVDLPGGSCEE